MEVVLIVGSGGREHALGWKLAQSSQVEKLYFAPGNGGTTRIGTNVSLDLSNHEAVIEWAQDNSVSLVVVAPDDYLAAGLVDSLTNAGICAFGPTRDAAKIEWSKAYAKEIMELVGIPTAAHESFTDYESARTYVESQKVPIVIKASGLAAGKGVVIAHTKEEAFETLSSFMCDSKHGEAGKEVVVEEFLEGQEFSVHVMCDGSRAFLFPPSQDHKQVYDHDKGPNTGGMGTIAPLSWVTEDIMRQVSDVVVEPLLAELRRRKTPFQGLLYPGLMMTKEGPKVIEFNARFGDPETQSYMRLLESDLFTIMKASAEGKLDSSMFSWKPVSAVCIILASLGYPDAYEKGKTIEGLTDVDTHEDVVVFHAGTKKEGDTVVTNGGRVLNVTAVGSTLDVALEKAYAAIKGIHFDGMHYRTDIGRRPSDI